MYMHNSLHRSDFREIVQGSLQLFLNDNTLKKKC